MKYVPGRFYRRSIRLKGYDYSRAGSYFVTICTQNRECLFGEIKDGAMSLNNAGQIVAEEWMKSADIRNGIELDEFVVMPNHLHGIIVICKGTARRAPTAEQFGAPVAGSLPTIIRSFKSAIAKRVNKMRQTPGAKLWQRNYYEHIIRNENELHGIRQYIVNNPSKWGYDRENPEVNRYTRVNEPCQT